jgi:hypothetical protein
VVRSESVGLDPTGGARCGVAFTRRLRRLRSGGDGSSAPFGPDLVRGDFTSYWVYVAGPLIGACLGVGAAFVLRGRGGGAAGSGAAQGDLYTEIQHPDLA